MTTLTDTITLTAGDLEADFALERGMVASSLRHAGEELLDVAAGRDGIVGIPLLHPWANRLAGHEYTLDGQTVHVPARFEHCEEHGLPIHGLLAGSPLWQLVDHGPSGLRARLDFGGELLEGFPFPHRIELSVGLDPARLSITTTLAAAAPVPIAFGFHPYLRLPGVPRERWLVAFPRARHLELDGRSLPTGRGELRPSTLLRLGDRAFDDGYDALDPGAVFSVAGGGRTVTMTLDSGYPVAQVFSPAGAPFICFEPMTAPTNALLSGAGLRRARRFAASFSIGVR